MAKKGDDKSVLIKVPCVCSGGERARNCVRFALGCSMEFSSGPSVSHVMLGAEGIK
jgi:hypothetical protein